MKKEAEQLFPTRGHRKESFVAPRMCLYRLHRLAHVKRHARKHVEEPVPIPRRKYAFYDSSHWDAHSRVTAVPSHITSTLSEHLQKIAVLDSSPSPSMESDDGSNVCSCTTLACSWSDLSVTRNGPREYGPQ